MIDEPSLTVPHPRLHQRAFVLLPLAEIAPDWEGAAQDPAITGQRIERIARLACQARALASPPRPDKERQRLQRWRCLAWSSGDGSRARQLLVDEEAAKLIQYQQAYQASAKVMQVAGTLFDAVLAVR